MTLAHEFLRLAHENSFARRKKTRGQGSVWDFCFAHEFFEFLHFAHEFCPRGTQTGRYPKMTLAHEFLRLAHEFCPKIRAQGAKIRGQGPFCDFDSFFLPRKSQNSLAHRILASCPRIFAPCSRISLVFRVYMVERFRVQGLRV